MIGQDWILFLIGWILSNFVIKFLLDSIERIYRDEIELRAKQLPMKIKTMAADTTSERNRLLIVFLEACRIIAMAFFLPSFLALRVLPFLRRARYLKTQFRFLQTLFSRDWMVVALVMLEVFSWRGLLLCVLCVFQISTIGKTDAVVE
jgi:hypothetical protein